MYDILHYLLEFEFVRFVGAGGTGMLLYYAIYAPLTKYRGRVHYLLSAFIAFVPAFAVSFILQKYWTFANLDIETIHAQFVLFSAQRALMFGLNEVLLYGLVERGKIHPLPAQVLAHAIMAVPSYLTLRLVFVV